MGLQARTSTCVDANLMTTDEYNTIKYYTAQLPFGADVIRSLGEIILRYGLEAQVGALYVHRHFEMPPASIVLKFAVSEEIEVARMSEIASLERKNIHGTSFRLMEGQRFQAFEYASNSPTPELPASFLHELAQFLNDNRLNEVLGLFIRTSSNQQTSCELNLSEPRVSVSIPLKEVPDDVLLEATPASWVYSTRCDQPNAVNYCSDPDPKVRCDHSKQPDSDVRLLEIITNVCRKRGLDPEIRLGGKGLCI